WLINALGEWVLRKACTDAANWPDDVKVAVNLSPLQVMNPSLVPTVISALATAGLPAKRLELEITESVMMQNTEAVFAALHRLRDLGVKICMDDFGTGYSSLSYLRRFPFEKLKIDRAFIGDLSNHDNAQAIVLAVITMARSLGMIATAEGIETKEQLEQIRALGCTEGQGYYLCRPVENDTILAMLERYAPLALKTA
ncbi:MAG: EAL domain-containing protein, partial [Pseudolabrys sp.]|nr:EAL domain-containing protein [Pseudolabrys sp.]